MSVAAEPDTLERFAAAYLRLRQLVSDSAEAQWSAGRSPVPRDDTTERSKGLVRDPTPSIVLDPRRLALRAAAIEAEQVLEKAGRAMQAVERRLGDAFDRWQG